MSDDKRPITQEELRKKPLSKEDKFFIDQQKERADELQRQREEERKATKVCPRSVCNGATLEEEEYHDFIIDRCPDCKGVWLDPGELEALEMEQESGLVKFFRAVTGRQIKPPE